MFAVTSFTGPSGSLGRNANIKVIRCREMVVLWALLSIKLYNIWFYQHAITLLNLLSSFLCAVASINIFFYGFICIVI